MSVLWSTDDEPPATAGKAGPYDTQVSPDDIAAYLAWKKQFAPRDSGRDYDLQGAFKAGLRPDGTSGHFSDQFKKPSHPTFSEESQYASQRPDLAGHWVGENTYVAPIGVPLDAERRREIAAAGDRVQELQGPPLPPPSNPGISRATRLRMLARQEGNPEYERPVPSPGMAMTPALLRGGAGLIPVVGGGLGEVAAQAFEKGTGQRDSYSPGAMMVQTALGLVPGASAGETALGTIARGAGKSALLGGAGTGLTALSEGRVPSANELAFGAGLGGVVGGVGAIPRAAGMPSGGRALGDERGAIGPAVRIPELEKNFGMQQEPQGLHSFPSIEKMPAAWDLDTHHLESTRGFIMPEGKVVTSLSGEIHDAIAWKLGYSGVSGALDAGAMRYEIGPTNSSFEFKATPENMDRVHAILRNSVEPDSEVAIDMVSPGSTEHGYTPSYKSFYGDAASAAQKINEAYAGWKSNPLAPKDLFNWNPRAASGASSRSAASAASSEAGASEAGALAGVRRLLKDETGGIGAIRQRGPSKRLGGKTEDFNEPRLSSRSFTDPSRVPAEARGVYYPDHVRGSRFNVRDQTPEQVQDWVAARGRWIGVDPEQARELAPLPEKPRLPADIVHLDDIRERNARWEKEGRPPLLDEIRRALRKKPLGDERGAIGWMPPKPEGPRKFVTFTDPFNKEQAVGELLGIDGEGAHVMSGHSEGYFGLNPDMLKAYPDITPEEVRAIDNQHRIYNAKREAITQFRPGDMIRYKSDFIGKGSAKVLSVDYESGTVSVAMPGFGSDRITMRLSVDEIAKAGKGGEHELGALRRGPLPMLGFVGAAGVGGLAGQVAAERRRRRPAPRNEPALEAAH